MAFRRWCSAAEPLAQRGVVNLAGLQPLVKAEIQWGMQAHAQLRHPPRWDCRSLQRLAIMCRAGNTASLFDLAEGKALNAVWVAGPGAESPGTLLSGASLAPDSRE